MSLRLSRRSLVRGLTPSPAWRRAAAGRLRWRGRADRRAGQAGRGAQAGRAEPAAGRAGRRAATAPAAAPTTAGRPRGDDRARPRRPSRPRPPSRPRRRRPLSRPPRSRTSWPGASTSGSRPTGTPSPTRRSARPSSSGASRRTSRSSGSRSPARRSSWPRRSAALAAGQPPELNNANGIYWYTQGEMADLTALVDKFKDKAGGMYRSRLVADRAGRRDLRRPVRDRLLAGPLAHGRDRAGDRRQLLRDLGRADQHRARRSSSRRAPTCSPWRSATRATT